MAYSLDSLAKEALAAVGGGTIESINEQSLEGARIRDHYQSSIDRVLSDYDWTRARTAKTLVKALNADLGGWAGAWLAPADMLVARRLRSDPLSPPVLYEFSYDPATDRSFILTNHTAPVLIYTSSLLPIGRFPPYLYDLVVKDLASRICMPLKKDASLKRFYENSYTQSLSTAQATDANSEPETQALDFIPESIRVRS